MSKFNLSGELIEYQTIDTDTLSEDFVNELKPENIPYELIGQKNPELVLILFAKLRKFSTEIIYREKTDSIGFLIFSTLRNDHYIRPRDISVPIKWTKDQVLSILKEQDKNKDQKNLEIDFTTLWQESGGLKAFLESICSNSQIKDKVVFTGTCSCVAMLYSFDWFFSSTSEIFHNDLKLK